MTLATFDLLEKPLGSFGFHFTKQKKGALTLVLSYHIPITQQKQLNYLESFFSTPHQIINQQHRYCLLVCFDKFDRF